MADIDSGIAAHVGWDNLHCEVDAVIFRVGQKVVCVGGAGSPAIDWEFWCSHWKVTRPIRNLVYTVRDTRAGKNSQLIRVEEIVNPIVEFSDAAAQEPWWWSIYFRPLVERKTDISIFTEMITKDKVRA
jgi:hypothetical protein